MKPYAGLFSLHIQSFIISICSSRGWIEKFDREYLFPSLLGNRKSDKRNNRSDDDDDDDVLGDDVLGDDDLGLYTDVFLLNHLNICLSRGRSHR